MNSLSYLHFQLTLAEKKAFVKRCKEHERTPSQALRMAVKKLSKCSDAEFALFMVESFPTVEIDKYMEANRAVGR